MRNKITLDMMDPSGYDCKYIISESDGSNTLELYMWSVGTNPIINFEWTDPDGTGHIESDASGFFLDSGEYYYSANPGIFAKNRLITMTVNWDGFTSREIYFQCVNLTADTNFTVTRDLSSDDLYRVAAAIDETMPVATTTTTGVVQIGAGLNVDEKGVISTPIASKEALGIVKIGSNITVYENGEIEIPRATAEELGVVQVGEGLNVNAGSISLNQKYVNDLIASPLTEYKYVSDTEISCNGISYTFTKNSDGLIDTISDDENHELIPTKVGNITDIALHNATILACAITKGLGISAFMPVLTGLVGYFDFKRQCTAALWTNRLGGDNIPITGSAAVNADCLQMPNQTYGMFKMPYQSNGDYVAYMVVKTSEITATAAHAIILASLYENSYGNMRTFSASGFAVDGDQYKCWMVDAYGVGVSGAINGVYTRSDDAYHILTMVQESNVISLYIDGVKTDASLTLNYRYGDYWGLNCIANNVGNATTFSGVTAFIKMFAIGRTPHTAEQIAANVAWLKQYYGLE